VSDGVRENLKLKEYSMVCWSRRVRSRSPHLHIIKTYDSNSGESEDFCFWASGWRQLVYQSDTMSFSFHTSGKPKKQKRVAGTNDRMDKPEELWNVIDLDSLIVLDKKGASIQRGGGPVPDEYQYGVSRKH
jgi:hypothetical protein